MKFQNPIAPITDATDIVSGILLVALLLRGLTDGLRWRTTTPMGSGVAACQPEPGVATQRRLDAESSATSP